MNNNEKIASDIIHKFEELLAENGIKIPNSERTGDETEACIFGTDYYALESAIADILCIRTVCTSYKIVIVQSITGDSLDEQEPFIVLESEAEKIRDYIIEQSDGRNTLVAIAEFQMDNCSNIRCLHTYCNPQET